MRRLVLILLLAACSGSPEQVAAPDLDAIAHRYVRLVLGMGQHDPDYVDAYYGPDSLKATANRDSLALPALRRGADSLLAELGDAMPDGTDSMLVMRHRYLRTQLGALIIRTRMVGGEKLTFDQEARGLYGVDVPVYEPARFDEQLARLDSLIPGPGALATRYQRFRDRVMIPPARLDTVFKVAIAACRARSGAHISLPPGERFDLEYVKGTSWNAYNWYKGGSHSLIQVNTDFPTPVDRAIDLACHEGYPGHHVYNASLERALVRDRGWVEMSVYPLFSPQSLIAEGSANYGIDMAFPGGQRTTFERDTLFPLAGLDTSLAEQNAAVRVVMERLNHARNEVARQYLDGVVDGDSAKALMQRWWLQTPEGAAKTLRFIDTYRSYVINYNLGRDMVARYVERNGGDDVARRWGVFGELLSSPRLPADLVAGP
ncbi:MAG: hypothetical protein ABIR59_03850 [Gemmatimonadales bacterium]